MTTTDDRLIADAIAAELRSARNLADSLAAQQDRGPDLSAARWLGYSTDRLMQLLVLQARTAGQTWAEIAETLNMSPQAAHKRYKGKQVAVMPTTTTTTVLQIP